MKKSKKEISNFIKAKIAIDLDDVIIPFVPNLAKWHNLTFKTNYKESDYKSYFFNELWGCNQEEAVFRVKLFEQTEYFLDTKPFSEAVVELIRLRENYSMILITSRREGLKKFTQEQVRKYLHGTFLDLKFSGNHYTNSKNQQTKAEIGFDHMVKLALEDSGDYAKQYADMGIKVLLFDKPWNRETQDSSLIHRIFSWREATEKAYKFL